jgi:putative ABC transport system permease protein
MNILNLSWKNILAKPLNSFMSVLLFALSIGLITFLTLFNHQLKKGLDNNLAGIDLVIGAKGSPLQLILNSMYHIDAPTGNIPIGEAAPFLIQDIRSFQMQYPFPLATVMAPFGSLAHHLLYSNSTGQRGLKAVCIRVILM